jgi:hypothetical protein
MYKVNSRHTSLHARGHVCIGCLPNMHMKNQVAVFIMSYFSMLQYDLCKFEVDSRPRDRASAIKMH